MAQIKIKLLNTKRSVLSKDNQVFYSAPNDYVVVQGENDATTFLVEFDETYNDYSFVVRMVNAKGEYIEFQLNDQDSPYYAGANEFYLKSSMAVTGYTKIYLRAISGQTIIAWEGCAVKIAVTSETYEKPVPPEYPAVKYTEQDLTEEQKSIARNNIDVCPIFKNISIASENWIADTTYSDFGYKADIAIDGVTANDVADVIFSQEQAASGNYANINQTGTNIVTIYSSVNSAITIPTIVVIKGANI